ncbi:MAG: c-type cytochrome [Planctomycetes bacterium]|nr:c-type cytochrome [Planctomycetota bacterium]
MADRGDTHYSVPRLNLWFTISSVLLLIASVWMVVDDWNAPWKRFQKEFREIEVTRAETRLREADMQAAQAEETQLQAELDSKLSASGDYKNRLAELKSELADLKGDRFTKSEAAKKAKQEYNWARWQVEEHRVEAGDPGYGVEELDEKERISNELAGLKEAADFAVSAKEDEIKQAEAAVTAIESEMKKATKDLELVRKKLEKLAPSQAPEQVANFIRDFPGLDFIDPKNKVEKVVLDDLTFELNFTKKKRIDMCQTCHQAIDLEGYEEGGVGLDAETPLAQPYLSHPRLDLFLTAKSPHPKSKIGCTICHRGGGEALQFTRVDHRPMGDPKSEEWGEEWHEEYHWHKQHHWDYPMLTVDKTEASCVQCHKTTMDLIADDAPTVSKGYETFERYGCYACHKVDWFPTKRKPAPTLKRLASKLQRDWVASWVANPKAFRPTTWMPQIFHLENYGPEDVVVVSKWSEGEPILGQQWNDTAVASITSFLYSQDQSQPLPAIPVAGDAERGREVFRVSGCLACHNLSGFEGEELMTKDLAFEPNATNVHGPNLRGVATKTTPEWIYAWIKDPAAYWPETRMPNLRLSDQDAADITAYMTEDPDGHFHDVPDGWEVKESPTDVETLREQARWFFSRLGRDELEARFAGQNPEFPWNDAETLRIAVGEKFVSSQGCFSCHEVTGYEDANPIGTELSNWGSKTVDKLDWGVLPSIFEKQFGWSLDHREQYKTYREHWLREKLHNPRIFDREKTKNPTEKLRMPYFAFDDEQVEALITFVVGLVDDEVQRAKMVPTAGQQAMNDGMRVVRRMNCEACHQLEPGQVEVIGEDGNPHVLSAELLALGDDTMPPVQRDLAALDDALAAYQEWYDEEIEEVGVRLLEPEPGFGVPGAAIFYPRDRIVSVRAPKGGDFVRTLTSYYFRGIEMYDAEAESEEDAYYGWNLGENGEVEDVDGQLRPYFEEQYDKIRWTFAPPVLWNEGFKLQREWFYSFLKDPVPLRRQMRVKMPTFAFKDGEAEAVADYFAYLASEEYPENYAKTMRLALGIERKESFEDPGIPWPELSNQMTGGAGVTISDVATGAKISVQTVEGIEAGSAPAIESGFPKVKAFGAASGFRWHGPVDPRYEEVARRSPSHLSKNHDLLSIGQQLAVTDVNCYQCHWHSGLAPEQQGTPIAWAPDLANARERLREDWVHDWLWNPSLIYPGTAMPANFAGDPAGYQETYPESTNADQIQAVMDWLYNLDRIPAENKN